MENHTPNSWNIIERSMMLGYPQYQTCNHTLYLATFTLGAVAFGQKTWCAQEVTQQSVPFNMTRGNGIHVEWSDCPFLLNDFCMEICLNQPAVAGTLPLLASLLMAIDHYEHQSVLRAGIGLTAAS